MIRVSRGAEPEELRRNRRRYLAKAFIAFIEGEAPEFTGYEAAKGRLYLRQHGKCVYCERETGMGSQPVEHFRPKNGALRNVREDHRPVFWEEDPYWWLAWSWQNLFFACGTCNGQDHKGNYFPIEAGSSALAPPPRLWAPRLPDACFEIQRESPLLVDPARDDPLEHIRWYPVPPIGAEDALVWAPQHRTARGDATTRILKLRGKLSDHIGNHIRRVVLPRVRVLRERMGGGSMDGVREEWGAMTSDLLAADRPYAAASHDALDYFVPEPQRHTWGLILTHPGTFEEEPPCVDLPDPEGFQHLTDELKWKLRAYGGHKQELTELLLNVCRLREWTVNELAVLVGLGSGHVGNIVRQLINEDRLSKVPNTRPYRVRST